MAEAKKKKQKKKALISEEDISLLLRRYTATTVLTLLQEVAQFPVAKIDWEALVKKTATGISNVREYQMLWRHLAYRDLLLEKVEDGGEPLDDDSDLESELEAFPPVSGEASVEAAAFVKVLLASGPTGDSSTPTCATVEAPLTINIPNGQACRALSGNSQPACTQGMNITVPVSVQKQPLPTATSTEGLDGNGVPGGNMPARRKRKPWTEEEDIELIAAVQKCGERNWANILKGHFKGDRTASQLSQRWSIIRKRQANLNPAGTANATGSQLSEAQLAARRAFHHALNMPMVDSLTAACSAGSTHLSIPSTSTAVPSAPASAPAEAPATTNAPSEANKKPAVGSSSLSLPSNQAQAAPNQATATFQKGTTLSSTPKPRPALKKPSVPTKSTMGPNPMVQAAAVAAGARIATPSTAASLLKAAQSKNAVHIRPGGSSIAMPSGSMQLASSHSSPRPNVHYIRTSVASVPTSSSSGAMPSILQPGSNSIRSSVMTSVPPPPGTATLNPTEQQNISVPSSTSISSSCGAAEVKTTETICIEDKGSSLKEEAKSAEEMKEVGLGNVPNELNHEEGLGINETTLVHNPKDSPNKLADENNDQMPVSNKMAENLNVCEKMVCSPVKGGG